MPLQQRRPGLLCPDPPWLWVCFTSLLYLRSFKNAESEEPSANVTDAR